MFRKINITDKLLFDEYQNNDYYASELNFANIFAWKEYDLLEIYHDNVMVIIKGKHFFFPPLTKTIEDFNKAIKLIKEYCDTTPFPFNIYGISEDMIPLFKFQNTKIHQHKKLNEYLYHPQDLIHYSGKKFHAKRNFVNQFNRNYQYHYRAYQDKDFYDVIDLVQKWTHQKRLTYETKGIVTLLENLDQLNCFCDCIIINNRVEAFAIGTISNNIGFVFFEKANTTYTGIYPTIVQLFSHSHFEKVLYINRQEDMGIKNLRKSKLSYNPVAFVNKYFLTYDEKTQLKNIYKLSFNDTKNYINYFFTYKSKQYKYLQIEHSITSVLYYKKQDINIRNQSYNSAFIFALSTHPFYRSQGLMKKLLQEFLNETDLCFVYLHPDINNFYQKFDFVEYGSYYKPEKVDVSTTENLNEVHHIYQQLTKEFDVFTLRDDQYWKSLSEEVSIDNGYIRTFTNNQGYLVNDGFEIIEYVDLQKSPRLTNYNMIRIVNLNKFIQTFNYTPATNLKVIDDLIPKNNITITVNQGEVVKISIYDLTKQIFKDLKTISFEKY